MKKITKILNKFNRTHVGMRKFLRLVSYGCYHRMLFERFGVRPRSYDDFLRQIRFFVPEKNLQVTRHDKYYYFTFVGDFRHGTRNYFYRSYLLKTLLPEQCLEKIILLQVLEEEEFLSATEILERAEYAIMEYKPDRLDADWLQSFRRRLNELVDSGIVVKVAKANKILYRKMPNPLNNLTANELKILFNALKFYRNVAPVGTAGYFLCDNLKSLIDASETEREIFQFKNNNFARILDDDILLSIMEAARRKRKVLVEREGKASIIVTPLAIETDFLCSRQYLVALWDKELMRLRVEKITSVSLVKEVAEKFLHGRERLREVRLKVKYTTTEEKWRRENILTEELGGQKIKESEGEFLWSVETPDPLQIYPRLWKIQPWAEILNQKLRERMRHDAKEALEKYAKFV
ncbi:MAG: hypothetical protein IJK81_13295 [Selenomonadaceae bacterium]|nr:hypothetical protein [Selenomonadaceae bacterium]